MSLDLYMAGIDFTEIESGLASKWVAIISEKNWWLQLDVSISMLWSSSGEWRLSEHTDRNTDWNV